MHVRLADAEPFGFLVKGAAEAAEMFAALTGEERDALPDAALLGIARLRGAIAEFTGEAPLPELPEDAPPRGHVVIEWPGDPFVPRLTAVYEVTPDGERLLAVTRLDVCLTPEDAVTADVVALAGEDGEPLDAASRRLPAFLDGEPVTVALRYEVASMRIRAAGH